LRFYIIAKRSVGIAVLNFIHLA